MKSLRVWIADRAAGDLILKDNGNLQFRYDDDYDGPALSKALPVQPEAHSHAVTRAVFAGLLPEQDARSALARTLGVSQTNDFELLAAVGRDCAGAITLLADGEEPETTPKTRPLDEDELHNLLAQLPRRPLAADPNEGIRLSLAGAQPKVPVIIDDHGTMHLPLNSVAPTTHILKPEPERFPGLVDNEAFCMELARECGLTAASVRKATTNRGLCFLTVERYDRDLSTEPIRRLHQEDFCQALGLPAERKYQAEDGPSFADAVELLRTTTGSPAIEVPRLVDALAFNWVIGNCDAHAKNYSLLYDRAAALAPLYDLVSTAIYPEISIRLAMSIDGATRLPEVQESAFTELGRHAGIAQRLMRSRAGKVLDAAQVNAAALVTTPAHDNDSARQINERIQALSL